ncbi:MAG: putative sugar nucleotidyl transferase [Planctomycetota bacterium]|nr:putative sugar nucleotidyl transferase [Planctomycetota bacterium]
MLPIVLYDPAYRARFFPFADFVPLWELRTGALKTLARWRKVFDGADVLLLPPRQLEEVAAALSPRSKVVSEDELPQEAIFVNSALIPGLISTRSRWRSSGNPFCKRSLAGRSESFPIPPFRT